MKTINIEELRNLQVTFNSNKADRKETLFLHQLPESSFMAVLAYGAQRFINDKLGGSEITPEEAAAKFDALLTQLKDGWVARAAASGLTDLEKEVNKLARQRISEAIRAKGLTLKEVGKAQVTELTKGYIAQHKEALEEIAAASLEAAKQAAKQASKLDASSINLGDLGL